VLARYFLLSAAVRISATRTGVEELFGLLRTWFRPESRTSCDCDRRGEAGVDKSREDLSETMLV